MSFEGFAKHLPVVGPSSEELWVRKLIPIFLEYWITEAKANRVASMERLKIICKENKIDFNDVVRILTSY